MSYVVQRQENEYRGKEKSLNFPKHPQINFTHNKNYMQNHNIKS